MMIDQRSFNLYEKNQQNEGKARLCNFQAWKGIKSSLLHSDMTLEICEWLIH